MSKPLPLGKLDMQFMTRLLSEYTSDDERVVIGAKVGEDAAVLDFGDRYLVAKTNPITFASDQIGWYVVNVCVNNMVVRGVRPRWMLNTLLLPEGKASEQMVEDIFRQIYQASAQLGVLIIGGHTEVTSGLDRPIVVGQIMGEVSRDALVASGSAQPGDVLLVTKWAGVEGTAIIARELSASLRQHGLPADLIARAADFLYDPGISIYKEALAAADSGLVRAMTDATEGGLATALHEMAAAGGVGLHIDGESLPVRDETARICTALRLDPFGLIASGALIMAAAPDKVSHVQAVMAENEVQCTVIGTVTDEAEGLKLSRGAELIPLPYFAADELTKVL